MSDETEKRLERIKAVLGCKTDSDLSRCLPGATKQQIYRWRYKGFHGAATEDLIDAILNIAERVLTNNIEVDK